MPSETLPVAARPPTSLRSVVRAAVVGAWAAAEESGTLPSFPADATRPLVEIARPGDPAHGDLATSLPLKLARPLRMPPIAIAEAIRDELIAGTDAMDLFADVAVAPPGFLNLRLAPTLLARHVDGARTAGAGFGRLRADAARRINVEFVSANPTGPLHIGNARGAFVGDLLARVLHAAGHEVTREYYFNDFGAQVQKLGESMRAIRSGAAIPEDGYRGEYVHQLVDEAPADLWSATDAAEALGQWASERIRQGIETSLERLGVHFDVWLTESTLHRDGWVDRAIERLRTAGQLYEQDGALWFRSTAFGDDKDRVIRRSNGHYTYFGADIGYLMHKFERGYQQLIYLWGSDHHGTVARVRNAAEALGYDRAAVEMLLIAWVRFVRQGRDISMSKRAGEFITLDDLLHEIGVDAARWFFAARGYSSGIDFDIEAAKDSTAANPVHYVRYAHARISSILRRATEAGLAPADTLVGALADDPVAQQLAKEIVRLPDVIEDAATAEETQGVTAYATELATVFHGYYRDRKVVDPDDPGTTRARLALVDAARLALANTLGLLGISAPESM